MSKAKPKIDGFYHEETGSIAYVVADPATGACAIIDPVLDFDKRAGAVATTSADALFDFVRDRNLRVEWILDTHPHADHLSAAAYLKEQLDAPTAIGERVRDVQAIWEEIYNLPGAFSGRSFWDRLFTEGDRFRIGTVEAEVLFSPGHTAASITYLVGDAAFIHDTLFMPDSGTARADFPGGDARALWRSIQRILALPPGTRLFTGHDYRPNGRPAQWESTVAEQRAGNIHLGDIHRNEGLVEDAFVEMRTARDASLPLPDLMLMALQVNLRGGRLPEPEANGRRYLKIPLEAFEFRRSE